MRGCQTEFARDKEAAFADPVLLFEEGYDRADLFAVFRDYSEDTLINELNDFLRRIGS